MRGIGEVARASGLGISALRFYDRAGVLVPAAVDPVTGYRRYSDGQIRAARLVAGLRRVGMPVAEIARAVGELERPEVVHKLIEEHLARLEDGLVAARRELSRLHRLVEGELDPEEIGVTSLTLSATELAAALDAVRFAAGTDPELVAIHGVLLESSAAGLTLVTSDRYRLAVAEAPATVEGPPVRVVAPLPFADALRPLLTDGGTVLLTVEPDALDVETAAGRLEATPPDVDFPDYRRVIDLQSAGPRRVTIDRGALREVIAAAETVRSREADWEYEVAILACDDDGTLRTVPEAAWRADRDAHVAVNREFLLQALAAGGPGQLELELDGPIKPLVMRGTGGFSLLMPVRE